jgi:DNA polymerase-3 subunit delta
MAKKTVSGPSVTHRDIINQVRQEQIAPIYLLMGEESYYIDRVAEFLTEHLLTPAEKEFNLMTIYCTRETKSADIINTARRYPMMARRQVVLVKEAQNLSRFDDLSAYAQKPSPTTVLVVCYKNGAVDRHKKIVGLIEDVGVVFESKRLKEGMLPSFIDDYLRRKQVGIEDRARMMLVENIGSDLNRMASELEKLIITLPQGTNRITPELIEKNIGISKEYNLWEFRTAVVEHDILKANKILKFFNDNPKANPPQMIIPTLFNFFAALMQAYYAPVKTEQGIMDYLDLRSTWQLRDFRTAMRFYTALKTMQIIGALRKADTQLKGIEKGNATDADVMRELLYFILH